MFIELGKKIFGIPACYFWQPQMLHSKWANFNILYRSDIVIAGYDASILNHKEKVPFLSHKDNLPNSQVIKSIHGRHMKNKSILVTDILETQLAFPVALVESPHLDRAGNL